MILDRIDYPALRDKAASPKDAAKLIKDGMTVVMSGYTGAGHPKVVPLELARRRQAGEDFHIRLLTSSQIGPDIADAMLDSGLLERCGPFIESRKLSRAVNEGRLHYVEQQMYKMPRLLRSGCYGKIDVAVIEALGITKEGYIIPTSSVGMVPSYINAAENIIVEINSAQPPELEGLHDIYIPEAPPNQRPLPLTDIKQRIGDPYMKVDLNKIRFIVESQTPERAAPQGDVPGSMKRAAANLLEFLTARHSFERLPPLQTGLGKMVDAILSALGGSAFRDIEFYCGGVSQAHVALMESGKVRGISTGSLQLTPYVEEALKTRPKMFRELLCMRNLELTNSAEITSRLGVIALNSGIEVDIFGNVNSSHITGSKVVNGLGGGASFAHNAELSVVILPSTSKNGDISGIVPMVSHQDICEHDVDILVTENGLADLRGKDDVERARLIIENCAAECYREPLTRYLDEALEKNPGHHPMLLDRAFEWHARFKETGSMLEKDML